MSDFNPNKQLNSVTSKIVAGLERISEVYKLLLWEKAKVLGLSPIQIQILIFVGYHSQDMCNVSHLAKEFNVTKPTISDAIRSLFAKKLIVKTFSSTDSRSYAVKLSDLGKKTVVETEHFADPIKNQLNALNTTEQEDLYKSIYQLIFELNRKGILSVQRTCLACRFFEKRKQQSYCNLLQQELKSSDIRIDCSEFQLKAV